MEFNLLKIIQKELLTKKESLKKIERYHEKNFGGDKNISDKLQEILTKSSEEQLKQLFEPLYPDICRAIKKGMKFSEYKSLKNRKPVEVLCTFVIYKFLELVYDQWKTPDTYEFELLNLISHLENRKTEYEHPEVKSIYNVLSGITGSLSLYDIFLGSPELYAYVTDIMRADIVRLRDIENTLISRKDIEDVLQCFCEFLDTNIEYQINDRPDFFLKMDAQYLQKDWQQFLILFFIGCLIKVFEKVIMKKDKEIQTLKASENTMTVYKEDTSSKKLAEQKQDKLNKLQIQYDRLQKKYDEREIILKEYEECFKTIQAQQDIEEKILDKDSNAKPYVPIGKGIVLYGGSPRYQQKFAISYPHVEIVPTSSVKIDRQKLLNAKIILINWRYLSHSHFYTIIDAIREHKKEYYYVW